MVGGGLPAASRFFQRRDRRRIGGPFAQDERSSPMRRSGLPASSIARISASASRTSTSRSRVTSGSTGVANGVTCVRSFHADSTSSLRRARSRSLDVAADHVATQRPALAITGGDQPFQQAMRLFGPPVLQGLTRLVFHHPRRFTHGKVPTTRSPHCCQRLGVIQVDIPKKHKAAGRKTFVIPPTAVGFIG